MRATSPLAACLLACLPGGAFARENLCFTAHAKGVLYCRVQPRDGAPLSVYDDGESPQRARTLFYCTFRRAGDADAEWQQSSLRESLRDQHPLDALCEELCNRTQRA